MIRLGGPVFVDDTSPEQWAQAHTALGYRAAYCPVDAAASDSTIRGFADAASEADLMIAEVGAWSNPIDPDPDAAARSVDYCIAQLALAERIGARCCVNITGSRHPTRWDGPHPDNFSDETFARIVETTRLIIDAVTPTRTRYTLEAMPWALPSTADQYLRLIQAIDRTALAAHLDPVNLVTSPAVFYNTGRLLRDCFEKIGPFICSAHAKDVLLRNEPTVQLAEVPPGQGGLDYAAFLRLLHSLPGDTPLMLEHLTSSKVYRQAADAVRSIARRTRVPI